MKKTLLFLSICLFSLSVVQAQQIKFVTDGVIEFNKSVNMYSVLQRQIVGSYSGLYQSAYENYKKNQPQFLVLKSNLSFAKDKALFEPAEVATGPGSNPYGTNPLVAQSSTIYTDVATNTAITQKNVLGELFVMKDSLRAIKWKITDETRDILGFPCRRANGIMMDSIYVVAFYTDDIPVSGGPEAFSGLPGMILQVALPHENVSWIATKITEQPAPALKPPAKGKATTTQEFRKTLDNAMKNFGPMQQLYLKAFLL